MEQIVVICLWSVCADWPRPPSLPPQQVTAAPALNQPGSWGRGSQASCFLDYGCLNVDYCWAGLDGSNLAPHWSLTVTVRLFTLLCFVLICFVLFVFYVGNKTRDYWIAGGSRVCLYSSTGLERFGPTGPPPPPPHQEQRPGLVGEKTSSLLLFFFLKKRKQFNFQRGGGGACVLHLNTLTHFLSV